MSGQRSATAIRFDEDLHRKLRAAADERGLTMNYLVNKLCAEGLECLLPVDELRFTRRAATA